MAILVLKLQLFSEKHIPVLGMAILILKLWLFSEKRIPVLGCPPGPGFRIAYTACLVLRWTPRWNCYWWWVSYRLCCLPSNALDAEV